MSQSRYVRCAACGHVFHALTVQEARDLAYTPATMERMKRCQCGDGAAFEPMVLPPFERLARGFVIIGA